ncbi:unnamed protein product, partial [Durusdinium trenchii]
RLGGLLESFTALPGAGPRAPAPGGASRRRHGRRSMRQRSVRGDARTARKEAGLATLPSRSADAAAWVIHEQTRRTAWSAAVGSLWEMLWNRLVPNVITCNSVIASTTKFAGAWIVGLYILESLRGRLELNPSSFNGLLPSLTWWSTLQLCNLMASCHVSADVISFSSSMRALDEVDLWPHALQRLDEMEMPNVVSYSSCGQGRWPLALELMQLSRTSRCFPTERSLGHCINACRKGGQWQIPLQMLTELDQHRQGNVICFSSAIDAVTFSGRWDVALELLAHMEDQKVFANDITYNAVLNACASVGQLDMALKLLEVMEELRCANVVSYSSCIATCEKGGHWQMALHLLSRGEGRRWPANAVSYSSAMSTCSKCSYWQVAISLLASMMGQALAPNTINFNCALSACETGANLPLALKILDTMRARAVPYDVISINSLLNACSTTNDWRCSLDLLIGGGPTDSRVSPNHISFNSAIGACTGRHWPWSLLLLGTQRAACLARSLDCSVAMEGLAQAHSWQMSLQLLAAWSEDVTLTMLSLGADACAVSAQHGSTAELLGRMEPDLQRILRMIR